MKAYNAEAQKVLSAAAGGHLVVDDLYEAVDSYCGANYKTCALQRPANVHFEPLGCTYLATKVVASIVAALGS